MKTGEKIRTIRIERGLTQKQLGDLCGMADSAIRRYESGRGNPTEKTLKRIAVALDISVSDICGDELKQIYEMSEKTHKLAEETREILGQYALALRQQEAIKVLGGERIEHIVYALDKMNDEGQQKAVERVEELTEIPRYRRQEPAEAPPTSPKDTDTPTAQDAPEGAEEDG